MGFKMGFLLVSTTEKSDCESKIRMKYGTSLLKITSCISNRSQQEI